MTHSPLRFKRFLLSWLTFQKLFGRNYVADSITRSISCFFLWKTTNPSSLLSGDQWHTYWVNLVTHLFYGPLKTQTIVDSFAKGKFLPESNLWLHQTCLWIATGFHTLIRVEFVPPTQVSTSPGTAYKKIVFRHPDEIFNLVPQTCFWLFGASLDQDLAGVCLFGNLEECLPVSTFLLNLVEKVSAMVLDFSPRHWTIIDGSESVVYLQPLFPNSQTLTLTGWPYLHHL